MSEVDLKKIPNLDTPKLSINFLCLVLFPYNLSNHFILTLCPTLVSVEDCNPGNIGLSCEMRQMKINRMFGFRCSCSECLIGDKNDSMRKQYHDLLFDFDRAKLEVPEALTNFVKMFNFQMKYMI